MKHRDILVAVDDQWRSTREILCRIKGDGWIERDDDEGEAYRARVQITVSLRPLRIQGLVERRRVGQVFEWRRVSPTALDAMRGGFTHEGDE